MLHVSCSFSTVVLKVIPKVATIWMNVEEAMCAAPIYSCCLHTLKENMGVKSTRSPFFLSLMPASLVSSLSSVIHSALPKDSQEAGDRSRGREGRRGRKLDGKRDRKGDRKDGVVCNSHAIEVSPVKCKV